MKKILAMLLLCAIALCAVSCVNTEEEKKARGTTAAEQQSLETVSATPENSTEAQAGGLQNGGGDTEEGWGALIPIGGN